MKLKFVFKTYWPKRAALKLCIENSCHLHRTIQYSNFNSVCIIIFYVVLWKKHSLEKLRLCLSWIVKLSISKMIL